MLHTPYGYWLEEAGPVEARPPLAGDLEADFVVIGGGYTGMWAAWCLLEQAPGARVIVLEADRLGHGPSGRNGGFLNSYWYAMGTLREHYCEAAALAIARAGAESVTGIENWCAAQGVDAWVRRSGHLVVSTAPAFDGAWRRSSDACGRRARARSTRSSRPRRACALRLADLLTRLALVEPPSVRVPPEPFRWVGGNLIRAAFLRKEAAEERGEQAGPLAELIAGVPARLGVHVGR